MMATELVERLADSVFVEDPKAGETLHEFRDRRARQWILAVADELKQFGHASRWLRTQAEAGVNDG